MQEYIDALTVNYARFEGRASRREYWLFILFYFLGLVACLFIDSMVIGSNSLDFPVLTAIYVIGTFIPSIAITVRRLHDTSRSGTWYFISFIPYIGGLILLILLLQDGHHGANQYGPDPKEEKGYDITDHLV
ncbi:MAG: DUF805 domain-containing protein [Bacteroidota bacterium]